MPPWPSNWRVKVMMELSEVAQGLLAAHEKMPADTGDAHGDELRRLGAQDFRRKGLPQRKLESWKHTSLASLRADYSWDGAGTSTTPPSTTGLLPQRIVFFNGHLCSELTVLESSCQLQPLADQRDCERITSRLQGQDGLMGLALAYCQRGYKLEVAGPLQHPLGLYHLFDHNFEGAMAHPLLLIEVRPKAHLNLFELTQATGELSSAFYNAHSVWELQRGCEVEHMRVFSTAGQVLSFSQVLAEVAGDAHYRDTILALGGSLLRNNVQVKLLEEGADTSLNGLYCHRERDNSSHYSLIEHSAPHTTSQQLYKGLLDHHSHASFYGVVKVNKNCPQIESGQLNKNILLSNTARVDSTPQLEIGNCDVKCAHGSTTGRLNPEEVFYLRSRGLSNDKSRQLLARAFCQDVVAKIQHSDIRDLGQKMLSEKTAWVGGVS